MRNLAIAIIIEFDPVPEKREEFLSKLEAHRVKPGHSHAWQESLLRSKRTITCDILR